jgi:hypothetical protein
MKFAIRLFALVVALSQLSSTCRAASIVIDSFDDGSFSLTEDGTLTNLDLITETIVNTRRVEGSGLGDWNAVLTLGSGFVEYDAQEIIPSGRPFSLFLTYTRSEGAFSLLGYNSVLLDFAMVSGSGLLEIYLDTSDTNSVVQVPLSSAGVLEYSFDNMAASSFATVDRFTISITPDASPFSFQLNEVSLVPEPSALILSLFGAFGILRRQRQ